jgi:hypothetical protein
MIYCLMEDVSAINFNQPSKGRLTSEETALTVINDGNGHGVFGESIGNGAGLWGISHGNQRAIVGSAIKSDGVFGASEGDGAGVIGESKGNGVGVLGLSHGENNAVVGIADKFAGVFGESKGDGAGVMGWSHGGQSAVVGQADKAPGVIGESKGDGAGILGVSQQREGVLGTTKSNTHAAVAGIQENTNPSEFPAGVYGESRGKGPGIAGKGIIAGRFEGDVEVTGDVRLLGADCAEDFDISSTENIEPGTVMVLNNTGNLEQSDKVYDKKVAGVVSGAGNYKPALILDKKQNSQQKNRLPIALMGKVYCKVDATRSSIEIGDLLTTSQTKGHAMKAEDPYKAFGSVIGKALGSITEGLGMIPVLVALQ